MASPSSCHLQHRAAGYLECCCTTWRHVTSSNVNPRDSADRQEVSLCSEMASELRFALKRSRPRKSAGAVHGGGSGRATNLRNAASSRASPKDTGSSEQSSESHGAARFHPLGPPYAQYEFDAKSPGPVP